MLYNAKRAGSGAIGELEGGGVRKRKNIGQQRYDIGASGAYAARRTASRSTVENLRMSLLLARICARMVSGTERRRSKVGHEPRRELRRSEQSGRSLDNVVGGAEMRTDEGPAAAARSAEGCGGGRGSAPRETARSKRSPERSAAARGRLRARMRVGRVEMGRGVR